MTVVSGVVAEPVHRRAHHRAHRRRAPPGRRRRRRRLDPHARSADRPRAEARGEGSVHQRRRRRRDRARPGRPGSGVGRWSRSSPDAVTARRGESVRRFRPGEKVTTTGTPARRAGARSRTGSSPAAPAAFDRLRQLRDCRARRQTGVHRVRRRHAGADRARRCRARSTQLARVKGVGPAKLEQYGDRVVGVIDELARLTLVTGPPGRETDVSRRRARTSARTRRPRRRPAAPRPLPLPARADIRPSSTLSSSVVAGPDLATEPGADRGRRTAAACPAKRVVGEHRDRADLGDRLAHQHARQRRPAREVAGEEPLVAGQPPAARRRHARFERHAPRRRTGTAAGAAAGRSGGQRRRRLVGHPASASRSFIGVSFGLILYQAWRTVPSGPTRNADRSMPM